MTCADKVDVSKVLSKHDQRVDKFVEYLTTQLVDIAKPLWFEFSIDAMKLVHNYVERSKEPPTPGPSPPPRCYSAPEMSTSQVPTSQSLVDVSSGLSGLSTPLTRNNIPPPNQHIRTGHQPVRFMEFFIHKRLLI